MCSSTVNTQCVSVSTEGHVILNINYIDHIPVKSKQSYWAAKCYLVNHHTWIIDASCQVFSRGVHATVLSRDWLLQLANILGETPNVFRVNYTESCANLEVGDSLSSLGENRGRLTIWYRYGLMRNWAVNNRGDDNKSGQFKDGQQWGLSSEVTKWFLFLT